MSATEYAILWKLDEESGEERWNSCRARRRARFFFLSLSLPCVFPGAEAKVRSQAVEDPIMCVDYSRGRAVRSFSTRRRLVEIVAVSVVDEGEYILDLGRMNRFEVRFFFGLCFASRRF